LKVAQELQLAEIFVITSVNDTALSADVFLIDVDVVLIVVDVD